MNQSGGLSDERALRIVAGCASLDEFLVAFRRQCDGGSIFIATRSPHPPAGERVSVQITLAGGEPVIRGRGRIAESYRDGPFRRAGIRIHFDDLPPDSRAMLDELGGWHDPASDTQRLVAVTDIVEPIPADEGEAQDDGVECTIVEETRPRATAHLVDRDEIDTRRMPPVEPAREKPRTVARAAIALALALGAGFALGRVTAGQATPPLAAEPPVVSKPVSPAVVSAPVIRPLAEVVPVAAEEPQKVQMNPAP